MFQEWISAPAEPPGAALGAGGVGAWLRGAAAARRVMSAAVRGGAPSSELSAAEAAAHAKCHPLSCEWEVCVQRHMYDRDLSRSKRECEPLHERWRRCFEAVRGGGAVRRVER